MTEFIIGIAGRKIRIQSIYEHAKEYCQDYLVDGEPDFSVTISMEDIEYERVKSAREDEVEGLPVREFSSEYLETLAIYRKIVEKMLDYGAFLFHGSAISVDGEGYLFTRFWRGVFKERCVVVNDDKPLLLVTENAVMICGTPWDGKHRLSTNMLVPLKGLVILERGERNEIEPVSVAAALPILLQQSYRPRQTADLAKTLALLEKLTKKTGLYRLKCTISPDAARVAYAGMQRKED